MKSESRFETQFTYDFISRFLPAEGKLNRSALPLQHAIKCLSDGGRVIVEDFAYECADEKTLHWFTSAARLLDFVTPAVE